MADLTPESWETSIVSSILASLTRRIGSLLASFDAALVPLDNDVDQFV